MLDLTNITIKTRRLLLVPVDINYASDIFRESTPEIRKYMRRKAPEDIAETIDFINLAQRQRETGDTLRLTILNKSTGEFIGGTDIVQLNSRTPKLGAWIKEAAQGKKYGLETITALANWAHQHIDYDYFVLRVDKRNIASRKIAETLGGTINKECQVTTQDGRTLDMINYWLTHNAFDKNK